MSPTPARSVPIEGERKSGNQPGTRYPVRDLPLALIYRPAKHPQQSAPRPRYWLLEFEPSMAPQLEPLMGWVSSDDVLRSVKLRFPDRESAIAFAEHQGWRYQFLTCEPKRDTDHAARKSGPEEKTPPRHSQTAELYDPVEEAGLESFPCSDPPAWTGMQGSSSNSRSVLTDDT